jgi:hypothetical protein
VPAPVVLEEVSNPSAELGDGAIPLGGLSFDGVSLLSLILTVICALGFLVLFIGAIRKPAVGTAAMVLRIVALAAGAVTIVVWIVLDKLQMPNVWIDEHTPVIIVLFAVFALITIAFNIVKRTRSDEQNEDELNQDEVYAQA